jgi:hypothetical protein
LIDRQLILEKKGAQRDSIEQTRAEFLRVISDIRPHVIRDLFAHSYPEFAFAVAEHFKSELFDDASAITDLDSPAFLCLAKHEIERIEDSHEPILANLPKSVRDSLVLPRLHLLDLHLRGRLSEPLLVEIVRLPLMRTIRRLMRLESPAIREAFPNWRSLTHTAFKPLLNSLQQWSKRWNLNKAWCRDHALRVLRHWLLDDRLRWSFMDADPDPPNVIPTREIRLLSYWNHSAKEAAFDVQWSQTFLSMEVHDGDPEPFTFDCGDVHIKAPGLNLLMENATDWKARVALDLRMEIYQTELPRLQKLKAAGSPFKEVDLDNKQSGAITAFEIKVADYIKRMTDRLALAKSQHELIQVKEKPSLSDHLAWTVRFQIPVDAQNNYESLTEIAKSEGVKLPAVSKAIKETLSKVDLVRRAPTKRGRIRGSKNRISVENETLRKLGR